MKLEDLFQEIGTDFPINKLDLMEESVKTSRLFVKYVKIWTEEKIKKEAMALDRKQLVQEKRDYYMGHAPAHVYQQKPFNIKIKTEQGVQKYIDADPEIKEFDQKLIMQIEKVEALTAAMDEIKRRGYAIKAALDHLKFMNGA